MSAASSVGGGVPPLTAAHSCASQCRAGASAGHARNAWLRLSRALLRPGCCAHVGAGQMCRGTTPPGAGPSLTARYKPHGSRA